MVYGAVHVIVDMLKNSDLLRSEVSQPRKRRREEGREKYVRVK